MRAMCAAVLSCLLLSCPVPSGAQDAKDAGEIPEEVLDRTTFIRTEDLPEIRNRRVIRVLVALNRTGFFILDGRIRGFEYELLREYEKHLNKGRSRREIPLAMLFIPCDRDLLLPWLVEGKGDIAAASLTVTPEREARVAFTAPYIEDVREVVVTHHGVEGLKTLGDLAGRTVYVAKSTSYAEHLRTHNTTLASMGLPPVEIVEVGNHLETEDVLELVNAGIIDVTVADEHLAKLWGGVHKGLVVRTDLVVNSGGDIALAVRKDNPELLADLSGFIREHRGGTAFGNIMFKRYYRSTRFIKNPLTEANQGWREYLKPLFRKYADEYRVDYFSIAALSYQESGWDQSVRSPVGAVGIMQVLPSTAADMGIQDVSEVESNIHAGVKYLVWMRDRYFADVDPVNQMDFIYASYNAGPNAIVRMREKAEEMGLDPDVWFLNVEQATRRYIGREPVNYVLNVNKYYVAFKVSSRKFHERTDIRESMKKP